MHATLIIGTEQKKIEDEIRSLVKNRSGSLYPFELKKIDDVRELSRMLKLSSKDRRTFLFENIDEATLETMNAFLKLLEEPNPGTSYILTAKSTGKIIPTVLSRVKMIKTKEQSDANPQKYKSFINKTLSEKLRIIDSIKKRDEAQSYLQGLIDSAHQGLINNTAEKVQASRFIKQALMSKDHINKNGNVNLHLSKFVLLIDSGQDQSTRFNLMA